MTFSRRADVLCGLTAMDGAGRAQVVASLGGVHTSSGTNLHGGLAAAAGLLMTAPDGLRRLMVVMSDGEPNVGIPSPAGLGSYVRPIAVSSLGFGLPLPSALTRCRVWGSNFAIRRTAVAVQMIQMSVQLPARQNSSTPQSR